MIYGLAFYRNSPLVHYTNPGTATSTAPPPVPDEQHLLVIAANNPAELNRCLAGRVYEPLFLYEPQGLEVYRVFARQ